MTTWEEITGSTEKVEKKRLVTPTRLQSLRHENDSVTQSRRARCLEAIFCVMPDSEMIEDGLIVSSIVHSKRFDWYPSSDCYYIHSTQKYGRGIERLCESILKLLLKEERERDNH